MIYLKAAIAGTLTVALVVLLRFIAVRRNRSPREIFRSQVLWALMLLGFALGAGLYWEFHGIVFYTGHVSN